MAHYDVKCKNCGFKGCFRLGMIRLKGFNFALGCKKCKKIITKNLGENYNCSCGDSNIINYDEEIKKEGKKARENNTEMKLTCPSCGKKEMIVVPGPIRD